MCHCGKLLPLVQHTPHGSLSSLAFALPFLSSYKAYLSCAFSLSLDDSSSAFRIGLYYLQKLHFQPSLATCNVRPKPPRSAQGLTTYTTCDWGSFASWPADWGNPSQSASPLVYLQDNPKMAYKVRCCHVDRKMVVARAMASPMRACYF